MSQLEHQETDLVGLELQETLRSKPQEINLNFKKQIIRLEFGQMIWWQMKIIERNIREWKKKKKAGYGGQETSTALLWLQGNDIEENNKYVATVGLT